MDQSYVHRLLWGLTLVHKMVPYIWSVISTILWVNLMYTDYYGVTIRDKKSTHIVIVKGIGCYNNYVLSKHENHTSLLKTKWMENFLSIVNLKTLSTVHGAMIICFISPHKVVFLLQVTSKWPGNQVELLNQFLLQILHQIKRKVNKHHILKAQLPALLAENEKEQKVI